MDGGSSLNLLYQDTTRKMGINPSRIKPTNTTFKGVIPGVEALCMGSITLEVVFGSPDNFRSEELIFDIVPFRSGYHALLGRPAFARFNAVPHCRVVGATYANGWLIIVGANKTPPVPGNGMRQRHARRWILPRFGAL